MANMNSDQHRKLMSWRLLDYLRDDIDPSMVFVDWIAPLENYRYIANRNVYSLPEELADRFKDILASDEPCHDPVLCEFVEMTRWMLAYFGDVTANLYPELIDRVGVELVREKKAESRKRLEESATRLLKALNAEPAGH